MGVAGATGYTGSTGEQGPVGKKNTLLKLPHYTTNYIIFQNYKSMSCIDECFPACGGNSNSRNGYSTQYVPYPRAHVLL